MLRNVVEHLGRKGSLAASGMLAWMFCFLGMGADTEIGWLLTADEASELTWALLAILGTFVTGNGVEHWTRKPGPPIASKVAQDPEG